MLFCLSRKLMEWVSVYKVINIETTNTEFSGRAPDCADGIRDLSDVTMKSALNTRNDSKNDVFTIARLFDDS